MIKVTIAGIPLSGKTTLIKAWAQSVNCNPFIFTPNTTSKEPVIDRGLTFSYIYNKQEYCFTTLSGAVWSFNSWMKLAIADLFCLVWDPQISRTKENESFFNDFLPLIHPQGACCTIIPKCDLNIFPKSQQPPLVTGPIYKTKLNHSSQSAPFNWILNQQFQE